MCCHTPHRLLEIRPWGASIQYTRISERVDVWEVKWLILKNYKSLLTSPHTSGAAKNQRTNTHTGESRKPKQQRKAEQRRLAITASADSGRTAAGGTRSLVLNKQVRSRAGCIIRHGMGRSKVGAEPLTMDVGVSTKWTSLGARSPSTLKKLTSCQTSSPTTRDRACIS